MSVRDILTGTGVALVTPFSKDGSVDFNSLGKLIDFVIDGGVNYLVLLGTTGETPTLDKSEKIDIIRFAHERAYNRVPLVIGIGGNNTKECIRDLEQLPLECAKAILSASPYYNKPSQEGLFQHYKAFADNTAKPILLYNVPGRTGRNISAYTTLRLANEVSNIAGIKEASGDFVQAMEIIKNKPQEFIVLSGDDNLVLPQIAIGMKGVISVAANCFPKDFSMMVDLCLQNDFSTARKVHYDMLDGVDLLFAENNPAGVKAFLSVMGIIENNLRLPLTPLSAPLQEKVTAWLKN